MKKPQLSIRTTLLTIIGILNIMIAMFVGTGIYTSWEQLRESRILAHGSENTSFLYRTQRYLSLERGGSLSLMYVQPETAKLLQNSLATERAAADFALDKALAKIEKNSSSREVSSHVSQVKEKYAVLQDLRRRIDVEMLKPQQDRNPKLPDQIFEANTTLIMAIRDMIVIYDRSLKTTDATVTQQMMTKYFVWEISEYAGREYAVIGKLIAENKPVTPELQGNLLTWKSLIQHGWETTHQFVDSSGLSSKLTPYMKEAETHYFMTFDQIKDIFYAPGAVSSDEPYPITTEMWLELASQAVDSLLALNDNALQETQNYVDHMQHDAERQIIIMAFIFIGAVSLSLYFLAIIILRVVRPVNAMVDALYNAAQGLPHDPLPVTQRNDEIGKLARVLEAFQENARQIEQSNEELERYAFITAHDLKSPLRAIDNLSQWIEEDLGESLTGPVKAHMDTLRKRVRRMEKLLNDTLEYSRISKQVQPANSEIMNGKTLIEDAVSLAAPPRGFTVIIGKEFDGLNLVRMPLQQVFYNLINNAIKHHNKDSGIVWVDAQEDINHYIFSVRDDGAGIAPEFHEKVFEMFQTLKPRDHKEGSGMGLAFVKKILTTRGGTITLESEPGHGALFRFTWPKIIKEKKNAQQYSS